ncbi:hypothetical protein FRC02_006409 [Tulasnella sp. 418]|nr:hypothetical protein FRC02_006409 [Tulasnella sp. 418]
MQNPKEEIADVVHKLTSTDSPNVQKDTLLKYFTSDASFNHPLCCVKSGDNSREAILGVYQWYRIMSPVIQIHVDKVVFDETGNVLHLDMVQTFHIFISLFRPAPAR